MGSVVAGAEVVVVEMEECERKESFFVSCHVLGSREEHCTVM